MSTSTDFTPFATRRSVVHSTHGIVSTTQPLASSAGLSILLRGGNAADAAIAAASVLGVTEPTSTGIGGDLFCLFYDASTKTVKALNASGRAPQNITLERVKKDVGDDKKKIPMSSVHAVTVPGAAAGWCDVVEQFGSGKFGMKEVLESAIGLAEKGYPVHELSASFWEEDKGVLKGESGKEMLIDGERAPKAGEVMKLPGLAEVMKRLAEKGRKGFYEGETAEAIVKVVKEAGGTMELEDLKAHGEKGSERTQPISIGFDGLRVWECAPNGQGIVALMALGIIQELEKQGKIPKLGSEAAPHNSLDYLHAVIESLRIAFSDGFHWISDPSFSPPPPIPALLSPSYLSERAALFNPSESTHTLPHGFPIQNSDTVYLSVTDQYGNGCSLINSTFSGFGSGLIPRGCSFPLQNRGGGFSLIPDHPNVLAPGKRPYHTIIPALLTTDSTETPELKAVFGVMGGFMQPQGHVQVLLNMLRNGMDPQRALDAPRICVGESYDPSAPFVNIEEGIEEEVVEGLRKRGHEVRVVGGYGRALFGRGQIVRRSEEGVWSAGSDMRGDGQAVGY